MWVRKEKAELNPLTRSIFYLNQSQGREVATVSKSNKTKMLLAANFFFFFTNVLFVFCVLISISFMR